MRTNHPRSHFRICWIIFWSQIIPQIIFQKDSQGLFRTLATLPVPVRRRDHKPMSSQGFWRRHHHLGAIRSGRKMHVPQRSHEAKFKISQKDIEVVFWPGDFLEAWGFKATKFTHFQEQSVCLALPPSAARPNNFYFLENVCLLASVPQASNKHLAKQPLRDPFADIVLFVSISGSFLSSF
jgi:hypothetical protein